MSTILTSHNSLAKCVSCLPVWALTIRLVAGLLTFTQTQKSKVTARLFELDEFRCSFWVFHLSYAPAGDGNPATEHHFSTNVHHTQLILVQYSYTRKAGKEQENLLQGRAEPSSAPLPNPHQRGAPRGKCTVAPRRPPPLMIHQPFIFPFDSAQKKKEAQQANCIYLPQTVAAAAAAAPEEQEGESSSL